jgi:hypothetical protein
MTDGRDRVDQLLYAGEEVRARVGRTGEELVVTSHRLLAVTPEGDGANVRAIHRPNVEGVTLQDGGTSWLLSAGLKALLGGVLALGGGLVVDLGGAFGSLPEPGASGVSAGGVLQLLGLVETALALVDDVLLAVGGVLLVVGVAAVAGYWTTRREELVVTVAGREDVRLDAAGFDGDDVATVEAALESR